MAIEFLKKSEKTPLSGEEETVRIVQEMLKAIESSGEKKVMEYTKTLDKYSGNVVVTPEEIAKSASSLSNQIKDDINFGRLLKKGLFLWNQNVKIIIIRNYNISFLIFIWQ